MSRLSPYLRHRLITEREVVAEVLRLHGAAASGKFVQEVLWRTYWKGWLDMRPAVWTRFLDERERQRLGAHDARTLDAAERGATGIDGFDDWARELVATGYLHNHARMWFASIWIFTLRLPWTLGADFFLRHLLDADAASNTLSWRWVAGLHTVGKIYLATADNIARCTNGRFSPVGLVTAAAAVTDAFVVPPAIVPLALNSPDNVPSLLLVTHEDMHPESVVPDGTTVAAVVVAIDATLLWGDKSREFAATAGDDTATRCDAHFRRTTTRSDTLDASTLIDAARAAGVRQIITARAPVGPVADALAALSGNLANAQITLVQLQRQWDSTFWPHATKGYFAFREHILALLHKEGLA
ncbi:MAG: FAD-binding domain-containing protein [Dokdonella sp.]